MLHLFASHLVMVCWEVWGLLKKGFAPSWSRICTFKSSLHFYTPPHDSGGVSWYHGCPSVRPSGFLFSDDNFE